MKKITILLITLFINGVIMAQLPANPFFEFEFTSGSLNNTSASGAPNFTGSITSISDRNASANDAAGITGVLSGASVGVTNVNEMTLSFWMKHDPIAVTSNERILQIYGTNGNGFRLQMDGNQLLYNGKAGNSASPSNTAFELVNIDDSTWHHIAIRTTLRANVNNSDTLEFDVFLDNVLQTNMSNTTINVSGTITNFLMNANLVISPTNNYSGDIDDMYFYKSALTNAEIAQIYFNNNSNCIVNVPDANFKTYLVGNALINTNGDTEIQCSEANTFTGAINCANQSISDFTGIEAFIAITNLYCSHNSLTTLNVSNNTALIQLSCSQNLLTTLNVSSNTVLTNLYCYNNSLTTLNVANGNNTALTVFTANYNPNLTCITVDDVAYSTANWTNIDAGVSFSTNCNAPCIVTIPDANFKAYLVGKAAINTNGDTEIQCSEANAYTGSISASGLSILDATGIEAFTNLTFLTIGDNPFPSIDLTQNISLISLNLSDNYAITNLDISNCTSLQYFTFSGASDLVSIDLSNNTLLTSIDLGYSQSLSALDVSLNTSLNDLEIDNSVISSLNVANGNNSNFSIFKAINNPNLTCITVDNVAYSTTNWTQIDAGVSFSTNCNPSCTVTIPDANFKAFLVSDPTINTNGDTEIQCNEAIAFSGPINVYNKSISDLTGIEAFVNLKYLNCIKNAISNLDVSANTALLNLSVNDNALTSLDVSNNLLLETFQCTDNLLTNIDITANTALTNFACSDNSLTTLDITKNTALIEFWCMNNSLTTLDVSNNTSLVYFSCYGNALTTLDMSNNTAIGTVYCDNNALTSINIANGNNTNISAGSFSATSNPGLACVQVDDVVYSTTNWTNIDSNTSFSTNCSGTVGVNEVAIQKVNIYPNPVQNELFIELENVQITEAIILDLSGKTIKSMTNNNTNSIDVSSLKQGVYILRVHTASGVSTKRFVKQ